MMSDKREKLENAGAAAKHRVDHILGHIWWAILIRGLLAIALALCAFGWPSKTLDLLVKLLGGYCTLDGILAAIAAYRGRDKTSTVVQTLVSLTLGIILLIWTDVSGRLFLILDRHLLADWIWLTDHWCPPRLLGNSRTPHTYGSRQSGTQRRLAKQYAD